MDLPVLDATDQRLLGSLLEKEQTVPASYPLSLNSLRTACNQTSSRDPISDYDEHTVEHTARSLKDRSLLRIVWSDSGRRTLKYHQTLSEQLSITDAERALITVLLLRGPQAPGELRTRTDRLHTFADRAEVEACLQRLAARPTPLVRQLERRAGQQDHRWVHLLGPVETGPEPAVAAGAVDRESVIADGAAARDDRIRAAYGAVATSYADHLLDELDVLPFERWLLDRIAADVDGQPVVEVGSGPGHITAYLARAGAQASGLDLTPAMVEEARRRFPEGRYDVGDLRQLMRPTTSDGWGAVLAWYSLIHLAASELSGAIASLARPIRPGGLLVLGLQVGPMGVRHLDEWFDHEVSLDFVFHDPEQVRDAVEAAGLGEMEWYHRGPVTTRGETTERFYVLARKPV